MQSELLDATEGTPQEHRLDRPTSEEREGQYRSIFDATNDGLLTTDLKTGCVIEASQVEIDLQYDAGAAQVSTPLAHGGVHQEIVVNSMEMRIRDDGHGFNPGELTAPGHYGLGMLGERAQGVGAELTVTSQPGHGTEVTLHWPGTPKQEA